MIVTVRTPLRVSLFGGGTDYPAYFHREPGAVLGFTIDKYIYLSALRLTASVDYRYRLSYSLVETVDSVAAIRHPVIRSVLQHYGFDEPTDFSVQADLPASVGLGSSSAFTVGAISLVSHLMGTPRTRMELAREAIHTEQVLLRENVGVQDQRHASAIVAEQVRSTAQGSLDGELREMLGLVDAAQQILEDAARRDDAPARIGDLLHQSWQVKK